MNTSEMAREQISALADGELADAHVDVALAALRDTDRHADWAIYHQIGEVLRSDDMAVNLSPDFSVRMAALLEKEPSIVAPMPQAGERSEDGARAARHAGKRWTIPGMAAAAAVAAVAFVTTPQLMVAMKGEPAMQPAEAALAAAEAPAVMAVATPQPAVIAARVPEGVILRDPRIDDYLLAHQRFSPSVYSTAQFARSATFETDSTK